MTGAVVVLGSLNIDHTVRVSAHPKPGETVAGRAMRILAGGKGANQAVAAARAGATVRMIGCIGQDEPGERYLARLRHLGIDVTAVRAVEGARTGVAHITVDDAGENSIIVIPGANSSLMTADVDRATTAIQSADVLLLQLETPLSTVKRAAQLALDAATRVVLNASPSTTVPRNLLQVADPVVVNEHELSDIDGETRAVCITLGAAGARWGEHTAVPPMVDVADTTGAGDAFAGTLAARLAMGDSPKTALALAVAAGAEATTWRGAQDQPSW
jgi:ribokinase